MLFGARVTAKLFKIAVTLSNGKTIHHPIEAEATAVTDALLAALALLHLNIYEMWRAVNEKNLSKDSGERATFSQISIALVQIKNMINDAKVTLKEGDKLKNNMNVGDSDNASNANRWAKIVSLTRQDNNSGQLFSGWILDNTRQHGPTRCLLAVKSADETC
ncbi:hypothetical protein CDAR_479001 [Caerostris darwini]|uniref:Uncharacterized protein n=1 Tax=Caerostris darwini TaxID=1538125 RepID=A0AAV4RSK1_9ARAC|nr:hypothetical protein CDAR_479001 [Caerostris darwini]